jgi:hypothetical protein
MRRPRGLPCLEGGKRKGPPARVPQPRRTEATMRWLSFPFPPLQATKRCRGRRGEKVRKPFPAAAPICRPWRGAARLGPTPGAAGQPLLGAHLGRHPGRRRRHKSERRSVVGVAEVGFSPAFMHSGIEIDGADVLIRDGRSEEGGP